MPPGDWLNRNILRPNTSFFQGCKLVLQLMSLTSLLLFSACATIKGSHQKLRITTNTNSSTVYEGKTPLGKAPGILHIKRSHTKKLTLQYNKQKKDLVLKGNIRWNRAIWGNVILGYFTGGIGLIGLGVDYFTGAMFEYSEPIRTEFKTKKVAPLKPDKIFITPTQFKEDEALADDINLEIYRFIKKRYKISKIVSVDEKIETYSLYLYNHKNRVNNKFQNEFLEKLGARYICESEAVVQKDHILAKVKIVDKYNNKVLDEMVVLSKSSKFKSIDGKFETLLRVTASNLIPNSIGVEYSGLNTINPIFEGNTISDTSSLYKFVPTKRGIWGTGISLTATNLVPTTTNQRIEGNIRLKTEYFLSLQEFANKYILMPPNDFFTQFTISSIGLGIGPEFSFSSDIGKVALSLYWVPTAYYLSFSESKTGSSSTFGYQNKLVTDLSYSFFISTRLNFLMYVRSTSSPGGFIEEVLTKNEVEFTSGSVTDIQLTSGVAIQYFFPEGRKKIRQIIRE